MFYKTKWNAGDIITTEKMNNILNNISSINKYQEIQTSFDSDNNNTTYYITEDELKKMQQQGIICYIKDKDDNDNYYIDVIANYDSYFRNYTVNEDGYLVISFEGGGGNIN